MGVYIGKLDVKDGRGIMVDWKYVDGRGLQADDALVKSKRPAEAFESALVLIAMDFARSSLSS